MGLERNDVDLDYGALTVRLTKFGRSFRLISLMIPALFCELSFGEHRRTDDPLSRQFCDLRAGETEQV